MADSAISSGAMATPYSNELKTEVKQLRYNLNLYCHIIKILIIREILLFAFLNFDSNSIETTFLNLVFI